MKFYRSNGNRVPGHIEKMAEGVRKGHCDRREFLAMASLFGASTAMAYGMAGLALPTPAAAQEPKKGGVPYEVVPLDATRDNSQKGARGAEGQSVWHFLSF